MVRQIHHGPSRKTRDFRKKVFLVAFAVLFFSAGASVMLYPTLSEYVNSRVRRHTISDYLTEVEEMGDDVYARMLEDARDYNTQPSVSPTTIAPSRRELYQSLLNHDGRGIMGYIEIPKIDVNLPIYHGTSEKVLQVGAGHLEGSSLPVGGESTHCVLSGHRGLPSAKLFTDIDQLEAGDTFMLHVLNETLTYEVDQILVVLPDETDALKIVEGEDYCTLVTCTPYGINSHRLLVRGHRVETEEDDGSQSVTGIRKDGKTS